ncbi:hypothetical protein PoB_006170000 [Plakobranchus ocellatus]|uniref:Uncharacterized protein n=1 Tax=Plakobranchus ocellatus TaxID=259542 RepID=A0AAV4CTR8_9GAST|nr:hypothetical protein PoB_006170000 [Plakobranchus ocellatus]
MQTWCMSIPNRFLKTRCLSTSRRWSSLAMVVRLSTSQSYRSFICSHMTILTLMLRDAFFGARHGKNPCEALGGFLKQAAFRAVKYRQIIVQSAQDLYDFLKKELSISDVQRSESTIEYSHE